jgi:hypothetical protein
MRNGTESFFADSPYYHPNLGAGDDVFPADNPTGRDSNHGFEGLTVTADGKTLYVLLQVAATKKVGFQDKTKDSKCIKTSIGPKYSLHMESSSLRTETNQYPSAQI